MNRKELKQRVSERTQRKLCDVDVIIDAAIAEIAKSISQGETITFNNVFSISPQKRKEKKAWDLGRMKRIIIPEHYEPHAIFAERIKKNLNKNLEKK